jgi:hypothetical protein
VVCTWLPLALYVSKPVTGGPLKLVWRVPDDEKTMDQLAAMYVNEVPDPRGSDGVASMSIRSLFGPMANRTSPRMPERGVRSSLTPPPNMKIGVVLSS